MDEATIRVLQGKLLCDFGFFTRFFFKALHNKAFFYAPHIDRIVRNLECVARQEITRDIINLPPRYGKTETAVKSFMAWGLANNPAARFMHLSYADSLVKDNSDAVRDIVKCPEYAQLFPDTVISDKTDSKNKWYTTAGGGIYAVSTGSPITGFGAGIFGDRVYRGTGSPADGFGGAIIIDDPIKPVDAYSDNIREGINSRVNNTFMSRLNTEDTPFIVIMQRLHDNDMTGFLLKGGTGEHWDNLVMKAIQDDGTPLYPEKHSLEDLEKKRKADPEVFAAQYQQSPYVEGGNIFKKEYFRYYRPGELPRSFDRKIQSWDLAFKDAASSDNVCGTVWGLKGPDYYLLDLVCSRMSFVQTMEAIILISRKYPDAVAKYIEAKANGDAIISMLGNRLNGLIPVTPRESKVARAHAVTPLFMAGNVFFPESATWLPAYEQEMIAFPNVAHDDRVDSTTQALSQTMVRPNLWDNL